MRARLAVIHSGINVELREVVLKDKPTSLLAYSEKATVPVLITAEKYVIDESRDIMQWALKQSDPDDWLCNNNLQLQMQMTQLIDENDNDFKSCLDKYKYADRYPEYTEIEHREHALQFIHQLELLLSLQTNLVQDKVCLADIAIFPFVRQFSMVEPSWFVDAPLPKLRGWLQAHVESSLFNSAMSKYPQWSAGDNPTYL